MRREADRLRRRTDFTAFGGPSSRRRSPTCRLRRLRVHRHGSEIRIEVTGDRFLHNMVRRLAGRLVQAGRGDRDRPWKLPAKGLTLLRVNYES
jgi:tRNA pseudouridine38-40 synthase